MCTDNYVQYLSANSVGCNCFYLFYHMGGIMCDEVLCCIDGTQDICDFDLKRSFDKNQINDSILLKINYTDNTVGLLTGRSLDILCSCLMLWLSALCVRTRGVTKQNKCMSRYSLKSGPLRHNINNAAITNTHWHSVTK